MNKTILFEIEFTCPYLPDFKPITPSPGGTQTKRNYF